MKYTCNLDVFSTWQIMAGTARETHSYCWMCCESTSFVTQWQWDPATEKPPEIVFMEKVVIARWLQLS